MTALVHQVFENLAHVVVVWALLEFQISAVLQVGVKLLWKATSQRLDRCLDFFVLDSVILVILVFALEALPRQITSQEVNQNEADALKVVSATLLNAKVSVHTGITRSTSQRLVVLVRDVFARFRITISLCQAKVDHVHNVLLLSVANQIEGRTICAFGEAAAWPTQSFISKFRDDFVNKAKSNNEPRNEKSLQLI